MFLGAHIRKDRNLKIVYMINAHILFSINVIRNMARARLQNFRKFSTQIYTNDDVRLKIEI